GRWMQGEGTRLSGEGNPLRVATRRCATWTYPYESAPILRLSHSPPLWPVQANPVGSRRSRLLDDTAKDRTAQGILLKELFAQSWPRRLQHLAHLSRQRVRVERLQKEGSLRLAGTMGLPGLPRMA